MFRISSSILFFLYALLISACSAPVSDSASFTTPTQAAIASAHPLATQAGMDILKQGGNAFDAAIAVAASLGVVEPYSAGIGGGGFWLLYEAKTNQYHFLDARERAPASAHRDLYVNNEGIVDRDRIINGPSAAAIPGQAAAFVTLAKRFGALPLSTSLQPSINQAREGFPIDKHYQHQVSLRLAALQRYPESARIFLRDNQAPALETLLQQPELANTLQQVATHGFNGFYHGPIAEKLVQAVNEQGGQWSMDDLANYRVVERSPIRMQIGEFEMISAPPPSSGGIALAQMLSMLEQFDWRSLDSVKQTHLIIEVMRRAYRDRAQYMGDPDFVTIASDQLLSDAYLQDLLSQINMNKATPSLALAGPKNVPSGPHTTHLSVIDTKGNIVSATLSINLPFGSAFTASGTGVLLNNHMDDFSASPSTPNAYGLIGSEVNAIAPRKRPLSSMTPTIIQHPQHTAVLGTPGGSRIISMVLLGTLEHLQQRPVQDWVSRARFHHQYLPDIIEHESNTFSTEEKQALQQLGHQLQEVSRPYGNMQAIFWNKQTNQVTAASDPRGLGQAQIFSH